MDRDERERLRMVDDFLRNGRPAVTHPRVLAAMEKIPRHRFIPAAFRPHAYENHPLPIGHHQTISQPFIIGYMTAWLDPQPGDHVLEIGTGCGYQTAILAELGCRVTSIEFDPALARRAARRLQAMGYGGIRCLIGDGFAGLPGEAPVDRIIATCAIPEPPERLIGELADPGRAIVPIGPPADQALWGWVRSGGQTTRLTLLPVRFVPNRVPRA